MKTTPDHNWLEAATDFALGVKRSNAAVALMLGAGASLSSGAPTTAQVHQALERATRGRSSGEDLRSFLHRISSREQQEILAPLFKNTNPSVGYRSLASIARTKRIHILNLNWDTLVEDSCELLKIPYVSFDIKDWKSNEDKIKGLPPAQGIVCVHVHGIIGQSTRYATLDTLSFDSDETRFLQENFLQFKLLITGTSLQGDLDFENLWRITQSNGNASDRWFFGRPWGGEHENNRNIQRLPQTIGTDPHCFQVHEFFDFDRLMLSVLENIKDRNWGQSLGKLSLNHLPAPKEMATFQSRIFRHALDSRRIAVIAAPRTGKSTLAHFLAHCFSLWEETDVPIKSFDNPEIMVNALASLSPKSEPIIIVLDDPFESDDRHHGHSAFLKQIERIENEGISEKCRIIITSRQGKWTEASQIDPVLKGYFIKTNADSSNWYSKRELESIAGNDPGIKTLIHHGELLCPDDVEWARKKSSGSFPVKFLRPRDEADADYTSILDGNSGLGLLCCLVCLQVYTSSRFQPDFLLGLCDLTNIPEPVEYFLFEKLFEEKKFFSFRQKSALRAVESYLRKNLAFVERNLASKLHPRHEFFYALEKWKRARKLAPSAKGPLSSGVATASFVYEPSIDSANDALNAVTNEWELTELTYEMVRLWDELPAGKARYEILSKIAGERKFHGAYAILEACLYHQETASHEIRDILAASAWQVVRDPLSVKEAALLIDGWMWRPLPGNEIPRWIDAFLNDLDETNPAWALVRFLAGYHPEGFSKLDARHLARDQSVIWTEAHSEFAVYLTQWHFIHQAYSRSLLGKLRILDKQWLCRTLHASLPPQDEPMIRLLHSMGSFQKSAGWAFHLGCSWICFNGKPSDLFSDCVRTLAADSLPGDRGIITASVTYEPAELFRVELRRYFDSDKNKDALLDMLADGIDLNGQKIAPPQFQFARDPFKLFSAMRINWPSLRRMNVDIEHTDVLASEIWEACQKHVINSKVTAETISRLCSRIERGDLRILETHATAARDGISPIYQIVDTIMVAHQNNESLFSPLANL